MKGTDLTPPKHAPTDLTEMLVMLRYIAQEVSPDLRLEFHEAVKGSDPWIDVGAGAAEIMFDLEQKDLKGDPAPWIVTCSTQTGGFTSPPDVDVEEIYVGPDSMEAAKEVIRAALTRLLTWAIEGIQDDWMMPPEPV